MLTASEHLRICHRCEHRQKVCAGPCPCTLDGVDIIEHARAGECPANKFEGAPEDAAQHEPVTIAVPCDQWPRRVKLVAHFRREGERGVGDTLARLIGNVGGEKLAEMFTRITGQDCGCADRIATLNARYPYT